MRFSHQEKFVREFERAESVGDCIHVLCRSIEADAGVQASLVSEPTERLRQMLQDACIVCPDHRLRSLSRSQLLSVLSGLLSDEIQGNAGLIVELLESDVPLDEHFSGPTNRLRDYFRRPPDVN